MKLEILLMHRNQAVLAKASLRFTWYGGPFDNLLFPTVEREGEDLSILAPTPTPHPLLLKSPSVPVAAVMTQLYEKHTRLTMSVNR